MPAFGWSSSKVRKVLNLLERLESQPLVREEFLEGRLDWTKAVEVARVIEQEPAREAHWLGEAQNTTSRTFRQTVAEALGEERKTRLSLELDQHQRATLEDARRALISEGFDARDLGEVVTELARRALEGGKAGNSAYRVILSQDPMTGQITQETRDGTVVVPPETLERILPTAEIQLPSGKVTRHIPVEVQRAVIARSRGRCEVPGCTELAGLELHHSLGWRNGHHPDRLFHLCHGHHRAIHEGALWIHGSWSEGVVFSLADGTVIGTAGGPAACGTAQATPAEPEAVGREAQATQDEPEGLCGTAQETVAEPPVGGTAQAIPVEPNSVEPEGLCGTAQETVAEPEAVGGTAQEAVCGTAREPLGGTAQVGRDEERDAVEALQRLEFSPRRARELVRVALARDPGLGRDAGLLVAEPLRAS
ncbi:MAG: HNH endonuclease signature motif containing protein [Planctomycetota bacterium]